MEKPFIAKNGLVVTENNLTIGNTVYVISNTNVGFGISSPQYSIHAYSSTDNKSFAVETQGSSKYSQIKVINGTKTSELIQYDNGCYLYNTGNQPLHILVQSANSLYFSTNNTLRATLTSNGNFGIGTSLPQSKLQVSGNSGFVQFRAGVEANSFFEINAFDGGSVYAVVGGSNVSAAGIGSQANIPLNLMANNITYATLASNGNFGIGNTTPSQKLHVQGTGLATGDFRAPYFYNSNDTNSYWNGNELVLRGTSPTVFFRDTDNNSGVIHCNGSYMYFLKANTDSTLWSNTWPLQLNLTNNDAVFGNNVTVSNGVYAPVYYDSNNSSYYLDPASNSVLNTVTANNVYVNRLYGPDNKLFPTLLTTLTASNSASISSSDVFSVAGVNYSDFMITFYKLVPDVNDKHIYLRWYSNGSYQTTNYNTYTGTFNAVVSVPQTPTTQYWLCHRVRNVVNRGYTGNINIFNAKNTDSYKQWYHDSAGWEAGSDIINRMWGGGDLNISTPITGFQIYAESGNISGVVKIYGLS